VPQLCTKENAILIAGLSLKEVHDAIFQMELNKALGPNGFQDEFYQYF
jgi:hypothetical protein